MPRHRHLLGQAKPGEHSSVELESLSQRLTGHLAHRRSSGASAQSNANNGEGEGGKDAAHAVSTEEQITQGQVAQAIAAIRNAMDEIYGRNVSSAFIFSFFSL